MSETEHTTTEEETRLKNARIEAAKKRVEKTRLADEARRAAERAEREKASVVEVLEPEDVLPVVEDTVDVTPQVIPDTDGPLLEGGVELAAFTENVIRGAAADWLRTPIGFLLTEPRFPAGRNATIGILEDNATRAFIAGVRWREGRGL